MDRFLGTMSSNDFYIVLPSNTQTSVFPGNKTSNYEIPLPKALEFGTATWEVALVEVHYPHSWSNIRPPFLQVEFGVLGPPDVFPREPFQHRARIEQGYYKTVEDLVEEINSLKPEDFRGRLIVSRVNKRVKVLLHDREYIRFHGTLATMLGFEESLVTNNKLTKKMFKAGMISDIHTSMHNIFVYTNIVRETLVGDGYYPLLRILPVEGEHGMNIHKSFHAPHYHEIAFQRITSLRITMCDDQSQAVRFQYGKVICKLHFRRKKLHLM